ncbi:MAG TPA: hypothetical protein VM223_27970 [Planctomycetota bacterium]|nr:hypothetical protein [Planctomycetota bacterium]
MIRLTLPIRTVSEANKREHWAVTARRVKEQRSTARLLTTVALDQRRLVKIEGDDVVMTLPERFTLKLIRIAPCKLDSGNLEVSFKGVQDGIADAIGIDDGDERITWQYAQERGQPKQYAVRVEIEEDEGEWINCDECGHVTCGHCGHSEKDPQHYIELPGFPESRIYKLNWFCYACRPDLKPKEDER